MAHIRFTPRDIIFIRVLITIQIYFYVRFNRNCRILNNVRSSRVAANLTQRSKHFFNRDSVDSISSVLKAQRLISRLLISCPKVASYCSPDVYPRFSLDMKKYLITRLFRRTFERFSLIVKYQLVGEYMSSRRRVLRSPHDAYVRGSRVADWTNVSETRRALES